MASGTDAGTKKKTPPTRCDEGTEIINSGVTVAPSDRVTLRLILCLAAFRVAVHLEDRLICDESAAQDEITLHLEPLNPGLQRLDWSFLTNADPWKVQSELIVNDVVRYRQRKASDGNLPFQHLTLFLNVR